MRIQDKDLIKKMLEHPINRSMDSGHWIWMKFCHPKGYGTAKIGDKLHRVHRLSAYVYLGLDIANHEIHALHKSICSRKDCYNPEHLYIGTNQENVADRSEKQKSSPNFPCGHPRTNKKQCKTCTTLASRRWQLKKKAQLSNG